MTALVLEDIAKRTPSSGMLRPPRLSPEATVGTTRRPAESRGAVARRAMFLNTPTMNSAYREESRAGSWPTTTSSSGDG